MRKIFLLSLLLLSGCLSGNVLRNRYYAPDGLFSFEAPHLINPGAVIKDNYSPEFGTEAGDEQGDILFYDDFGSFLRVNVLSLSENTVSEFETKDILSAVQLYFLDIYKKYQADTTVKHQEFFDYQGNVASFFVVEMKNGSVLAGEDNQRFYAQRASVAFVRGRYVYVFTKIFSDSNVWDKDKIQSNAKMKASVLQVADTLEIEK